MDLRTTTEFGRQQRAHKCAHDGYQAFFGGPSHICPHRSYKVTYTPLETSWLSTLKSRFNHCGVGWRLCLHALFLVTLDSCSGWKHTIRPYFGRSAAMLSYGTGSVYGWLRSWGLTSFIFCCPRSPTSTKFLLDLFLANFQRHRCRYSDRADTQSLPRELQYSRDRVVDVDSQLLQAGNAYVLVPKLHLLVCLSDESFVYCICHAV